MGTFLMQYLYYNDDLNDKLQNMFKILGEVPLHKSTLPCRLPFTPSCKLHLSGIPTTVMLLIA